MHRGHGERTILADNLSYYNPHSSLEPVSYIRCLFLIFRIKENDMLILRLN